MRRHTAAIGTLVLAAAIVGCGANAPTSATNQGDAIEPVAPDEGSGSAAGDRTATAGSTALLEPVTLEDAITVIGTGSVTVAMDQATVFVSVTVTRDTVAEAQDEAARTMGDVLDAIRGNGVADEDLQTVTLSLQPVYAYDDDGTATRDGTRLVGYRVDNGVRVIVRDLDALAGVVDDAMAAGATGLDGIEFSVSDPMAAEAEARRLAVEDARTRAEALATGAGVSLGRVIAIGEAEATPVWPYSYARAADVGSSTPIEAGTSEVSVSVQVAWAID